MRHCAVSENFPGDTEHQHGRGDPFGRVLGRDPDILRPPTNGDCLRVCSVTTRRMIVRGGCSCREVYSWWSRWLSPDIPAESLNRHKWCSRSSPAAVCTPTNDVLSLLGLNIDRNRYEQWAILGKVDHTTRLGVVSMTCLMSKIKYNILKSLS